MECVDCAYLINTTPKYFYLLPLHITLLKRYAKGMTWPIYIATESPATLPSLDLGIRLHIIPLPNSAEGFLESRAESVRCLPPEIRYVFPIQEDFLLEGRPSWLEIYDALRIMDIDSVSSVRLMPCPGPKGENYSDSLKILDFAKEMVFTYQATLWRREAYQSFMDALIATFPPGLSQERKNNIAIKVNIAEIEKGQNILKGLGSKHLSYVRDGPQPNAVYLCPWPYRPTAVVRGLLEPWAAELAVREGLPLPN